MKHITKYDKDYEEGTDVTYAIISLVIDALGLALLGAIFFGLLWLTLFLTGGAN